MERFTINTISSDLGKHVRIPDKSATGSYSGGYDGSQFYCYDPGQDNQQIITTNQILNNEKISEQPIIVQKNSNFGAAVFDDDEEAAKYIEDQIALLYDDNDQNDAETIRRINDWLKGLICLKEFNGEKYIAYDTEQMLSIMSHLDSKDMLWQLLSSICSQTYENEASGAVVPDAIIKLGLGGSLENTKLEIEKDGAGVRLKLTSNNNYFPLNEIKNKTVAYAASEDSARNYFMNGDKYDLDAIEEWFKAKDDLGDNYHDGSIEYNVLADEMDNMNDAEISRLLDHACYRTYMGHYILSDRFKTLMDVYQMQTDIKKVKGIDFTDKDYARAVMVLTIADRMNVLSGLENNMIPEISYDDNQKAFTGIVHHYTDKWSQDTNNQKIIVYLPGSTERLKNNFLNVVDGTIGEIAPSVDLKNEVGKYALEQAASFVYEKTGVGGPFQMPLISEVDAVKQTFDLYNKGEGARTTLGIVSTFGCMYISGLAVNISDDVTYTSYIYDPEYNDEQLVFAVGAYNKAMKTKFTIADMKNEYLENTEEFNKYKDWYTDFGDTQIQKFREDVMVIIGQERLESMSVEEIEAYLAENN